MAFCKWLQSCKRRTLCGNSKHVTLYNNVNAVSEALVSKLLTSKNFMPTLADKLLSNGALDCVKQSIYEASAIDSSRLYVTVTAMEGKLTALNSNNKALSDEKDALEQYSTEMLAVPRHTGDRRRHYRVSFRSARESWT